mgnify:FL=1
MRVDPSKTSQKMPLFDIRSTRENLSIRFRRINAIQKVLNKNKNPERIW